MSSSLNSGDNKLMTQVISTFQQLIKKLPINNISFGRPQKIVIISLGGLAALGIIAYNLRRKRYVKASKKPLRPINNKSRSYVNDDGLSQASSRRSGSPSVRSLHRQASLLSGLSDRLSQASGSLPGVAPVDPATLSPQQLGVMGMESLETSIQHWEDALALYSGRQGQPLALTGEEEAEFSRELQRIVEAAYNLQDQCELLFLDQRSVLFRAESSVRGAESEHRTGDYSSPESFVSAQDQVADLREFEEFADVWTDTEKLPLYQSALKQFEEVGGIPYRTLRTEMVHCSSDVEYLCKLHCIRLAFQWLFRDPQNWAWFANNGRQVLCDLLLYADKDTKDLMVAYEEMLLFLRDTACWPEVERELGAKGVKAMTFYDVVMDYILMDAFDDLDTPPASVTAVVQNRWLSNGFKETALATAVWSVLKTKRRMLKFPNGFMAHFYAISEQMSPLMAWGFLGPDEDLKAICLYFREQVMGFLTEAFSFQKTRYTSVEELSEDIFSHIKCRVEKLSRRLSSRDHVVTADV